MVKGEWVYLENCHLVKYWLMDLERIYDDMDVKTNPNYRLWLTTQVMEGFPVGILKSSIKITIQSEVGIRQSVLNTYSNILDLDLNPQKNSEKFKTLFFGLALFHANI